VVNASLNWASIVGIVLAVGGAFLYFMRSFKPALARDYDVFFAAVGLLCGGILFFQGWRLDPILQFGQFLLAGTTVFFAYESVRLRGVTTEQARRSSYFDDDEPEPRPRMGGGRAWGEGVDRFDEPQPLRRRIRSRDEGYDERAGDEEDFYRPRRPTRAAIPERAASRGDRPESGPNDPWAREASPGRDRGRNPERPAPTPSGEPPSRYRAGSSAPAASDFGARRQGREEQRRGSRPGASGADDMPRSSRRPGGAAAPANGIPQGSPYQQRPAASAGPQVSDADFSPVRPPAGERPRPSADQPGSPPAAAPRDNSSRFDD
jgi:hypothetical protein